MPDTFPRDIAGFTDPEETPEERAEYFEQRYKGLSPEQRAELEAFDKENEEIKYLTELEEFGLIERIRQGLGKPSLIYVKNFIDQENLRVIG